MTESPATRSGLLVAKRIVVKVGSSSLASASGGLDQDRLAALVAAMAQRRSAGSEVVLVSSGAIAAGLVPLQLPRRPRDLATLQAAASVGQSQLVESYARAFGRYDMVVAQVLLTAEDVIRRAHYRNARRTLQRLLALDVVPVVNENDAVATEEIRFGDNDRLAALVAHLVAADALFIFSDVDGLYDGDPRRGGAQRVSEIRNASELEHIRTGRSGGALGTGGMASKVAAAQIATGAGVAVLLAAADDAEAALSGGEVGTFFAPTGRRYPSRILWLAHASTPAGRLHLDAGAVRAVTERHASVLAAGVTGVEGDFTAGDPVDIIGPGGSRLGRGLVGYDAQEMPQILGQSTRDLGPQHQREVVHRDDLVLLPARN